MESSQLICIANRLTGFYILRGTLVIIGLKSLIKYINTYSPNVTFLYPLKTSENIRFSDVFRGYRNVTLGEYGLRNNALMT